MPNLEQREHWNRLAEMGCVVCKQPANIHHCIGGSIAHELGVHRAMSQKNSDWLVIPLCYNHHQGPEGLHAIGVLTWESRYGSQLAFLDQVNSQLTSFDLFEKAGLARRRRISFEGETT